MHPCAHRCDPTFPAMNGGAGGHWGAHACALLTTELETLEKSCWCSEAPGRAGSQAGWSSTVLLLHVLSSWYLSHEGDRKEGARCCAHQAGVWMRPSPVQGAVASPGGPLHPCGPFRAPHPPPGWRVWESAVGTFLFCVGNGAS